MTLDYGEPQVAIAIVFLVLALAIAAVAVMIAIRSTRDVALEEVQRASYTIRRPWLGLLVALLVVMVGASFFLLPYASGESSGTRVKVSGGQFF